MVRSLPDLAVPQIHANSGDAFVVLRPTDPYVGASMTVDGSALSCTLAGAEALYAALGLALGDPMVATLVAARNAAALGETPNRLADDAASPERRAL